MNTQIGKFGEQLAKKYLLRHNFQIIAENFFTQGGEIDFIATKSNELYFFEVRTRTAKNFMPENMLSNRKRHLFYKASRHFLNEFPQSSRQAESLQFFLILIILSPNKANISSYPLLE